MDKNKTITVNCAGCGKPKEVRIYEYKSKGTNKAYYHKECWQKTIGKLKYP